MAVIASLDYCVEIGLMGTWAKMETRRGLCRDPVVGAWIRAAAK